MNTDNSYYFVIFTLFNFVVFALFYISAYFFERRIRPGSKRVRVSPLVGLLLHFKGVYGEHKLFSSRTGVGCELFALAYFAAAELFGDAYARLTGNWVRVCRIGVAGTGACVVGFLAVSVVAGRQIRRADAEREKRRKESEKPLEVMSFGEAVAAEEKQEENSPEKPEPVQNNATQTEKSDNVFGIAEGMEEFKKRQNNPLDHHH